MWSLVDHVTKYMRRPRMGDAKHPTLWPSSATALTINQYGEQEVVGACRRSTFFRYLQDSFHFYSDYQAWATMVEQLELTKTPTDPYMLWIWRAGELYEEHLVQLARDSGVFLATQVPIYVPAYNISGKLDLIAINPETGKRGIVEAKSVYGFNANYVMGTPAQRKHNQLGTPKESNLMQVALYDWFFAKKNQDFEDSRLTYGARDTGRFAEYQVHTELAADGKTIQIQYRGIAPCETPWALSPITMNSILEQYQYIQTCLDTGQVPDRDYSLQYSDDRIQKMYERQELNRADTAAYEKRLAQIAEGKKKVNKQLELGDFYCRNCQFASMCWKDDGTPKELDANLLPSTGTGTGPKP